MTRPLVRVVFALLVLATIAAFLVTQQLKSEFPLVIRFAAKPLNFSPNGDGVRDATQLGFDLSEPARVTFSVMDEEGNEVRRLFTTASSRGTPSTASAGTGATTRGACCRTASTGCACVRRDEGRVIDSTKEINVDTPAPARRAHLGAAERDRARASPASGRRSGSATAVPATRRRCSAIFRTGRRPAAAGPALPRRRGRRGRLGRAAARGPARPRRATTRSPSRCATAPATRPRPPPRSRRPRAARPGTGVSVRPLTLSGPLTVVPAGAVARLQVGPFDRSFDFVLSR